VTLNLAETSVVSSRPSVPYDDNLFSFIFYSRISCVLSTCSLNEDGDDDDDDMTKLSNFRFRPTS